MENRNTITYDFGSLSLEQLLMEYFTSKKNIAAASTVSTMSFPEPMAETELSFSDMDEDSVQTAENKFPEPKSDPSTDPDAPVDENEFIKLLYNEISQRLLPIVDEVLNAYETEHSPIYDAQIDRETIAQIVDQVIMHAAESIPEIEDIAKDMDRDYWGRYRLLRSIVEAIVLNEIFMIRRPNRNKMSFML